MMNADLKKIAFICHFSNEDIRERLHLKSFSFGNFFRGKLSRPLINYKDSAIWISDYIEEFKKNTQFEYHIIAPHIGMKDDIQNFSFSNINYHFFKCDYNFFKMKINSRFKIEERNNYQDNRRRIIKIIDNIRPDLICLCGAENPYYSLSILDISDIPILTLMQTALLNPQLQRSRADISPFRIEAEAKVLRKTKYIGTSSALYGQLVKAINPNAIFLRNSFPSHQPPRFKVEKSFDFVFFSSVLTKNKGIEDTISAFCKVSVTHPETTLDVIGSYSDSYLQQLYGIIQRVNPNAKISFEGHFSNINDMYRQVQKAKYVVIPGITAPLNSTVRESMLLGMPTIVYETTATPPINKEKQCLLTAKMQNVSDLTRCMSFAYENPNEMYAIAKNGKEYALRVFSNDAIGKQLISCFHSIIDHYYYRKEIPENLLLKF